MRVVMAEFPSDLRCPACGNRRTLEGHDGTRVVYTRCARCGWHQHVESALTRAERGQRERARRRLRKQVEETFGLREGEQR